VPGRDYAGVRVRDVDIACNLSEDVAKPAAAVIVIPPCNLTDLSEVLDALQVFKIANSAVNVDGRLDAVGKAAHF
jgi:hypothetical protein